MWGRIRVRLHMSVKPEWKRFNSDFNSSLKRQWQTLNLAQRLNQDQQMLGQEQALLLANMIKDHQQREQEKLSTANLVETQN